MNVSFMPMRIGCQWDVSRKHLNPGSPVHPSETVSIHLLLDIMLTGHSAPSASSLPLNPLRVWPVDEHYIVLLRTMAVEERFMDLQCTH